MFPIRDELPTRRTAFVSRAIVLACAAVFLLTASRLDEVVAQLGAVAFHFTGRAPDLAGLPPGLRPIADDGTAWVRAFAHMFLHGGFLHLAMNVWFLWIFADNVEDRLGHVRFALFYLACGLGALAAQVAAAPASAVPMVGASGAISGVMGAYVVLYPRAPILTFVPLGFIPLLLRLPAIWFLGVWFVLQVFSGLFDTMSGVAFWAHAGGFVAGVLLVKPLSPRLPREREDRTVVKGW